MRPSIQWLDCSGQIIGMNALYFKGVSRRPAALFIHAWAPRGRTNSASFIILFFSPGASGTIVHCTTRMMYRYVVGGCRPPLLFFFSLSQSTLFSPFVRIDSQASDLFQLTGHAEGRSEADRVRNKSNGAGNVEGVVPFESLQHH